MNNLNSVLLEGNLTKDPENKNEKNIHKCMFKVASNRYNKNGNESQNTVSYFDVECSGELADVCKQYLAKGRGVRIIGRLKQERHAEEIAGVTTVLSKIIIIAEQIEFKQAFKSRDYLEVVK